MSKLVFSTLSIFALLLSGTSCSIGVRGGGGGDSPICKTGLVLNPGDRCSGPDYSFQNNDGELTWKGSYTESCASIYVGGGTSVSSSRISNSGSYSHSDSTGGHYICDDLSLARNGNAWTITRLPPPAATVR